MINKHDHHINSDSAAPSMVAPTSDTPLGGYYFVLGRFMLILFIQSKRRTTMNEGHITVFMKVWKYTIPCELA
jgi:hypothetical protein